MLTVPQPFPQELPISRGTSKPLGTYVSKSATYTSTGLLASTELSASSRFVAAANFSCMLAMRSASREDADAFDPAGDASAAGDAASAGSLSVGFSASLPCASGRCCWPEPRLCRRRCGGVCCGLLWASAERSSGSAAMRTPQPGVPCRADGPFSAAALPLLPPCRCGDCAAWCGSDAACGLWPVLSPPCASSACAF